MWPVSIRSNSILAEKEVPNLIPFPHWLFSEDFKFYSDN